MTWDVERQAYRELWLTVIKRGAHLFVLVLSPTAESFGVSAQIGSRVVRGGREAGFHEGSTRVPRGSAKAAGWCEHRMLLGM